MAKTDFFDDDLVKHRKPPTETLAEPGATEAPARGVSDLNLTRMARHREQVEDHMAHAAQELERLRQRQEHLEKEKSTLEELRRRQAEYERGKRDMLEHLHHSLISLEKDELNAEQLLEQVTRTRQQCREWLAEIDSIDEAEWGEESFREELGKALTRVEDVRVEYNKALAKVEALSHGEKQTATVHRPVFYEDRAEDEDGGVRGFAYWLKVGFAVSLPVILTLVVLWVLYYMHSMGML